MQTLNGKLVVPDPNQFPYINQQMEDFTQQLEQIELQVVTAQQLDRREYINQLKILKLSVQNLEQLYKQLLSTTILSTVILAVLFFWLAVMRQPSCNKSQANNSVVTWKS